MTLKSSVITATAVNDEREEFVPTKCEGKRVYVLGRERNVYDENCSEIDILGATDSKEAATLWEQNGGGKFYVDLLLNYQFEPKDIGLSRRHKGHVAFVERLNKLMKEGETDV